MGPEAQLEQLLDGVGAVHLGADGWVRVPDEAGNWYYYNSTDGASQWDASEGHTLLVGSVSEITDLCRSLQSNLMNVALTTQHMVDFYQILVFQGADQQLVDMVMFFLHAQATQSGTPARDLLESLPEAHQGAVVHSLLGQLGTVGASVEQERELDESSQQVVVGRTLLLLEKLLLLPDLRRRLSDEEAIRLVCEACRRLMVLPVLVSRALACLSRITRQVRGGRVRGNT